MSDLKLHLAVGQSNTEAIQKLIDAGFDVNKKNSKGNTPLHFATILCKDEKIPELLLKAKADVSIKNNKGFTALQYALDDGNLNFAKILIEAGADVDSKGTRVDETALQLAIERYDRSFAKFLLEAGADPNTKTSEGQSIVEIALDRNNLEVATLFINFGADVESKSTKYAETALHLAAYSTELATIELLLSRGANIEAKNCYGETPLHHACLPCHENKKKIKCLLDHGADINALDKNGRTPLMNMLVKLNSTFDTTAAKTLDFLLKYSNINLIDFGGNDILKYCKKNEVCVIFLKHIAKLQALNSPIHPKILETILSHDVNSKVFKKCADELVLAKNTKIKNCWITVFDVLVDSGKKLKNYSGNMDFIKDCKYNDCLKKFTIYNTWMWKKVSKGIRTRKVFDKSSVVLSDRVPVFNPTHLVIRDILDFLSTKELTKLCK